MELRAFLDVSKALGEEARVRAVAALEHGELCLCQLIELLGLAPSTVSRHMDLLARSGLVLRRRQGRWQYFRLAGRDAGPAVRRALQWTLASLRDQPRIREDRRRLRDIVRRGLEEVAACYRS